MRVYIIRHGESETNVKSLFTGWMDVNLTDLGKIQAKRAGELLKNIRFDKVYSSDLIRARETAENTLAGCCYETSELLRETNVGDLSGKPYSVVTDEQRILIAKEGFTVFGGESNEELNNRISKFIKTLETETCENVAVFTHGGWLKTFLDIVMGVKIPNDKIICENCTVAIFECTDGIWKLHSWINWI